MSPSRVPLLRNTVRTCGNLHVYFPEDNTESPPPVFSVLLSKKQKHTQNIDIIYFLRFRGGSCFPPPRRENKTWRSHEPIPEKGIFAGGGGGGMF